MIKHYELPSDLMYTLRVLYHRWVDIRKSQQDRQFKFFYPKAIDDRLSISISNDKLVLYIADTTYSTPYTEDWICFEMGLDSRPNSMYVSIISPDEISLMSKESGYIDIRKSTDQEQVLEWENRVVYVYQEGSYWGNQEKLSEEKLFQYGLLEDCIEWDEYRHTKLVLLEYLNQKIFPTELYIHFSGFHQWDYSHLKLMKEYL